MKSDRYKAKVLIVDDQQINREILAKLLIADYEVVEADNGSSALNILQANKNDCFSAIILDILMPGMDGYTFLEKLKALTKYADIPVLVATAVKDIECEQKAFELGAWDFVAKPYNASILLCRLKNAIERSRLSAFDRIKYLVDFDELTGIFNKRRFFRDTAAMLDAHPDTLFAMFRFDINHFKLINSFYGTKEGDSLLQFLANGLRDFCGEYEPSTYGRIESDVFAFCLPFNTDNMAEEIMNRAKSDLRNYKREFAITPTLGIYRIENRSIPVEIMLDNAAIAAKKIKDSYASDYAVYADDMDHAIRREQRIINEMHKAMERGEFQVYYQPKVSLETGKITGSEALVRWIHPEKGLVSPSVFIPIFEHNGFILHLDYYVWEQTCKHLQEWMAADYTVHPVSVNISRVDFYNPQLAELLLELTRKYDIPVQLLNLEITESIFSEDVSILCNIIDKLHDYGFTVMIDDFGSGFSSLNILKDIDVDVLKIDLRFLSSTSNARRSEIVLKAVIRMANELGIDTIAEGVETEEQAEMLRTLGCARAQGFLYARPMPKDEYEGILAAANTYADL